ncbi:MAG: hypothetical protein NTU98_01825 [Bacteroidetes bacterium]|nr:hypothetical protein [Bacteroidota bacterium]
MNAVILLVILKIIPGSGYITGAIISLFILGYLVFSLAKPDKF